MSGNKKDMRRPDLVVPYAAPKSKEESSDLSSTLSSTLPMAALFTRNRMLGWAAVTFALQTWLSETPAQKASGSTPGYFSVLMAMASVAATYLPLFFPPPPLTQGSSTEAPAAAPPA